MLCPNCGKESKIDQKFCRSCGMNLEAVSKAIALHQGASDATDKPAVTDEKRALRRMGILLFFGVDILLMGLVLMVLDRTELHNDWLGPAGVVLLIAGAMLSLYGVLSPLWREPRKNTGGKTHATPAELGAATSPTGLPAPPASITEPTTNLLEPEPVKLPGRDTHKDIGA